ncbi:MAG TPA: hypothetical protein VGJ55_12595 [Pyrinomonadaceae bacterium]|jgi:hypothetical protein
MPFEFALVYLTGRYTMALQRSGHSAAMMTNTILPLNAAEQDTTNTDRSIV